jgi:hypothetical protein
LEPVCADSSVVVVSSDRCNMIRPEVGLEVAYESWVVGRGEGGALAALEGR